MKYIFFRISGILYFLTFILIGMFGLPQLAGVLDIVQHSDILINTSKYTKKYVCIDSIDIYQHKGIESGDITGYSKELDDYETRIEIGSYSDAVFGSKSTVSDILGEKNEDKECYEKYIWYKKGATYAYVSDEEENRFPASGYVKRRLHLFRFIIIFFIINRISKFIAERCRTEEEENQNI
ncbi:MAG: hypothetical protein Q4C98_10875 [Capnocytophaga sp.]|nr:hypothetical protein [Capnocytophaga sp.]